MKRTISLLLTIVMVFGIFTSIPIMTNAATISSNMVGNFDPYSLTHAEITDISMGGNTYKNAIKCRMGYTGTSDGHIADAKFNFNSKYESLSFCVGYISGETSTAQFRIFVDGKEVENVLLTTYDLPKQYKLSLEGVNQVILRLDGNNGYDGMYFGIGGINAVSDTDVKAPNHYTSNMVNNCEPYFLKNGEISDISMGGDTYDDAIKFRMGYTGSSDGHTGEAMFNFNGMYESLTFSVGYISGIQESAQFTILVDGEEVEKELLYSSNLPRKFTVSLKDVHQVVLRLQGNNGYDGMWYGIGGIDIKSNGVVQNIIMLTKEIALSENNRSSYAKAVIVPPDAIKPEIEWSSSNPAVAKVNQQGLITAVSEGTAIITATTVDGGYSDICTVNVDFPPKPATPKVSTTNEIDGVQVSWNAVDNATKYVVFRRQAGTKSWVNIGTTTGTTLFDKNVKSGVYYSYSVRAYDSLGQYSDFVQANTQNRKYMATPKLTTIYNHVNGLAIKWNAVAGVTNGYRVYRRGAGSTYWTYLGTTKNLYFIDSAVKNNSGKYFRYTVIADGDYHSKFDTTGLYLMRLANPTLVSATSSKSGITVKWGAVKGTTGYYVYRKTANSNWTYIAAVGGTNNTTFLDKTAKKSTTYTYTVKAVYGSTTSAYNSGISCYDKY